MTETSTLDRTFTRTEIGPGQYLHLFPTKKFKTTTIRVFIRRLLDERTSTFAVLTSLWKRGTRSMPDYREMVRHLESLYGASYASGITKYGPAQVGGMNLRLVSDRHLPEPILDRGLAFLGEALKTPYPETGWTKARVEKQKENLVNYIMGLRSHKAAYAEERCIAAMYPDEPFGRYEYGSIDEIPLVTPDALVALHDEVIRTAPIDIFLYGDFEPEAATDLVRTHLTLPDRHPSEPGFPPPLPPKRKGEEIVEELPVRQGKLCMGYRLPVTFRDDAFPAALVMNGILGAFPHSKLFRNVREKANLAYYCLSSLEKVQGLLLIQSGIASENFDKATSLIQKQIEELAAGNIADDELERTLKSFARDYRNVDDTPSRFIRYMYSQGLVGKDVPLRRAMERTLATTKEEIVEVARGLTPGVTYFIRSREPVSTETEGETR